MNTHAPSGGADGRIAEEVAEIKAMEERQENVTPPFRSFLGDAPMVVAGEDCGLYESGGDCFISIESWPGLKLVTIRKVSLGIILRQK